MGRTRTKFVKSLHLWLALRRVSGCVALGLCAPIIFVLLAWLAFGRLHAGLAVLAFCAVLLRQQLLGGLGSIVAMRALFTRIAPDRPRVRTRLEVR